MAMEITNAEEYRESLDALLRRQANQPVELLVVDDITEWCAARQGNGSGNPVAMAVVDGQTGRWGILLRRRIGADQIASVLSRIEYGGFERTHETLNPPTKFLEHTVLHELAHLQNRWNQDKEEDCDRWAFERMELNAV